MKKRTRSQRKTYFGVICAVLFAVLFCIVWTPMSYRWQSDGLMPGGVNTGESTRAFGMLRFLEIHRENVTVTGAPVGQSVADWKWRPLRLTNTILATILFGIASWLMQQALVRRYSLLPEQCDECAYDLRAIASNVCPECGASITPLATRRAIRG